ncbi:hypothetical protein ACS91J_09265 [Pectobacterium carotovorum]
MQTNAAVKEEDYARKVYVVANMDIVEVEKITVEKDVSRENVMIKIKLTPWFAEQHARQQVRVFVLALQCLVPPARWLVLAQ